MVTSRPRRLLSRSSEKAPIHILRNWWTVVSLWCQPWATHVISRYPSRWFEEIEQGRNSYRRRCSKNGRRWTHQITRPSFKYALCIEKHHRFTPRTYAWARVVQNRLRSISYPLEQEFCWGSTRWSDGHFQVEIEELESKAEGKKPRPFRIRIEGFDIDTSIMTLRLVPMELRGCIQVDRITR